MWAPVSVVPEGNPLRSIVKSPLAAVMVPAESLVRFRFRVIVPLAPASALVTGGTSLAGDKVAVNFTTLALDGVVGVFEPHPTAMRRAAATMAERFIRCLLEDISRTSARC